MEKKIMGHSNIILIQSIILHKMEYKYSWIKQMFPQKLETFFIGNK